MLTSINLKVAMNGTNNSHSMVSILIYHLAIIIVVAIYLLGFCYERFCCNGTPTEFKASVVLGIVLFFHTLYIKLSG